ncbi:Ccc1 family, partial [Glomus cerebriforme]
ERRFHYSEIIRDVTIGLADGLTVPFALAAGLSSLGNRHLVILGCLVEMIASTITKSIGGWATSKAAEHHYWEERNKEILEIKNNLDSEIQEMIDIMQPYEIDAQALAPVIEKLVNNPDKFADFMMKFESNLEKPNPTRSLQRSLTIGTAYFVSGLIPLIPYFFIKNCMFDLYISSGITLTCLILLGYIKGLYTYPDKAIWGATQSFFIGLISAAVAYGFVFLIRQHVDLFEII